jgi:hypothetical protein
METQVIPGAICKTLVLNYRNYRIWFSSNFLYKISKNEGKIPKRL